MTDSVASDIIEAIAEAKGVDPEAVDFVLHDYLDPEALSLLADHDNSIWMLTFNVPGHEVTVTSDGDILVDKQQLEDDIEV